MTQPVKSLNIEEATDDQRLTFARQFLNLDIASDANDATVRAAIATANGNSPLIFVQTNEDPADPETASAVEQEPEDSGPVAGTLGQGDPRATIIIPVIDTQDDSGSRDITVGVNGRAWQLMRGVPLSVPWRVVEALQNARGESLSHVHTDDGKIVDRTSSFSRHAFAFEDQPSAAEIKAWHERTDNQLLP